MRRLDRESAETVLPTAFGRSKAKGTPEPDPASPEGQFRALEEEEAGDAD